MEALPSSVSFCRGCMHTHLRAGTFPISSTTTAQRFSPAQGSSVLQRHPSDTHNQDLCKDVMGTVDGIGIIDLVGDELGRDADEQQARFAQRAAEQSETDLPDEPPTPPRQLRSKGKGRASAAKPTFVLDEASCSDDADGDDDGDGSGSYEPESGGSNNEESSREAD